MGIARRGVGAVSDSQVPENGDQAEDPAPQQLHRFSMLDEVAVVHHEGRGRAEVNHAAGGGGALAELTDMSHDFVAGLGFDLGHAGEIDLVDARFHLVDRGF